MQETRAQLFDILGSHLAVGQEGLFPYPVCGEPDCLFVKVPDHADPNYLFDLAHLYPMTRRDFIMTPLCLTDEQLNQVMWATIL